MKGYTVSFGYMGYLPTLGRYLLFCSEDEYAERFREEEQYDTDTQGTSGEAQEGS